MNFKIVVLVYIIFGLLVLHRFYTNQIKNKSAYSKNNENLLKKINTQKMQIKYRQERLNVYNFLKYNIEDALITQPKIAL